MYYGYSIRCIVINSSSYLLFSKKKEIYKERRKFFFFFSSSLFFPSIIWWLLSSDAVRVQSNSQNFFSLKNRHSKCVECRFWKFLQKFFKIFDKKYCFIQKVSVPLSPEDESNALHFEFLDNLDTIFPVRPRLFLPMKVSHGRASKARYTATIR